MREIESYEKKEIALWRRDLEVWAMIVLRHGFGWIGGLSVAALGFLAQGFGMGEANWMWWAIFAVGIIVSCFQG